MIAAALILVTNAAGSARCAHSDEDGGDHRDRQPVVSALAIRVTCDSMNVCTVRQRAGEVVHLARHVVDVGDQAVGGDHDDHVDEARNGRTHAR